MITQVQNIREAILKVGQYSEERLKEIKAYCESEGFPIKEHSTIGEYNLDLHKCFCPEINDSIYQVSISRGQINPFEKEQQNYSFTARMKDLTRATRFVEGQLKTWVMRYGAIFIGTLNESKFDTYLKFMQVRVMSTGICVKPLGNHIMLLYDAGSDYAQKLKSLLVTDPPSPKEDGPQMTLPL